MPVGRVETGIIKPGMVVTFAPTNVTTEVNYLNCIFDLLISINVDLYCEGPSGLSHYGHGGE